MNRQSAPFLLESELINENLSDGITRQIMGYNGEIMMVKIYFKKGAVGALHEHYHAQATYVASGTFEVEIGGVKQVLKEGEGFFAEPDITHGVACLEDGILIDVFTPMREDFLK